MALVTGYVAWLAAILLILSVMGAHADGSDLRMGTYGASDPAADLVARAMAGGKGPFGLHDRGLLHLARKQLTRLCRKECPDSGAVPAPNDSTSPNYLPEATLSHFAGVPRGRVILWHGGF
ncbi:MAG: hypothetical protein ACYC63_01125 [Armatimonadota bacterium]